MSSGVIIEVWDNNALLSHFVVVCNILIDSVSFMCGQLVYIEPNLGGIIGLLTLDSSGRYFCSEILMPRMVCVKPNSASHS